MKKMDNNIYTEIINGAEQLLNLNLDYISGRNSIKITEIDRKSEKIHALRGEEEINISFDRLRVIADQLAKGILVDVNDALGAGGNDRSAIETIIAHLPHVGYYNGSSKYNESKQKKIAWFKDEIHKIGGLLDASNIQHIPLKSSANKLLALPKPFLLLAGISGTGKTRFVREQAASHRGGDLTNYCLIPVRPDWHEPSDLLGYISRIGQDGARYVVTDLLRFVVCAWRDAAAFADAATLEYKSNEQMTPHWLCLDEMNLAPVEQYFADYLSVLETRKWKDGKYSCDSLFKPDTMRQLDAAGLAELRGQLGLGAEHEGLWQYFVAHGISLPPNLIVAGTVNMDETTHGFSRKVIDRAFTIDFGVFYPNDFSEFFDPQTRPKTLGFPMLSHITADDLAGAAADAGGAKSIAFLGAINGVLKGSPFELAYRALNELLLAVVCFQPKDDAALRAVWDDFLMTKVLPRIDGDAEKLSADSDASLLTRLMGAIDEQFKFDGAAAQRPDLLRENRDGSVCTVNYRAKQKLDWMQKRLDANGFTTFWP